MLRINFEIINFVTELWTEFAMTLEAACSRYGPWAGVIHIFYRKTSAWGSPGDVAIQLFTFGHIACPPPRCCAKIFFNEK
jgi:hypothetical protein